MKKINWVFWGLIFMIGFFGDLSSAEAGCCIKTFDSDKSIYGKTINCVSALSQNEIDACVGTVVSDNCSIRVAECGTSWDEVNDQTNISFNGCCVLYTDSSEEEYGKAINCSPITTQQAKNACIGTVYEESCSRRVSECGSMSGTGDTGGSDNTGITQTVTTATIPFVNPIKIKTVSGLLDSILTNLMGLIVIIAVIFIIIGGILYMTSAGNETMVTRAKQTWTGAVVGLAIALASPTFLKQIQAILNSNSDTGGSADNWVNKALTIKEIAMNVLDFLLSVFGVLAIIALVIGGGMYLTAYGDEKKIDSGKKIITYAIIGIVVALSALVVTRQIAGLIGVTP